MPEKMLKLFGGLFVLLIGIMVIGALIQDAFGIDNAAEKIFLGIGGIGVIIVIIKIGIHKNF